MELLKWELRKIWRPGILAAILLLLVRKLIWCFRWLWCYHHGRQTPEPISFLPRRSGRTFDEHVDQTGRGKEE